MSKWRPSLDFECAIYLLEKIICNFYPVHKTESEKEREKVPFSDKKKNTLNTLDEKRKEKKNSWEAFK